MGQIQWEIPEDQRAAFSFQGVMAKVRLDGYFMGDNIYLRHDSIMGACVDKGGDNVIPFPAPQQPLNS